MLINKTSKIYIAGHLGLVGSALLRTLEKQGYTRLIYKTRSELNLIDQRATYDFFEKEKPEYVFLAAAKVGGILANNTQRGEFIYENLMVQANVIEAARQSGVKRLMFLGSSCIYPRDCEQPMREDYLLSGALEQTNEPYAVAKIAGIKLCEAYNAQYGTDFISVMPTNLYGPNDNFDLQSSHVLPALLRKIHEAKKLQSRTVTIWGSGKPRREFMHVDDLAAACLHIMNRPESQQIINIGSGDEVTIQALAELICEMVGFEGHLEFDKTKPDGISRKLLDTSRLSAQGWSPTIKLKEGLEKTYQWFLAHESRIY